MPADALPGIVGVIDLMEFRRALVVRFLNEWSLAENVELLSFVPESAHRALRAGVDFKMIIFNVGSSSSAQMLSEINVLRALAPSTRLVVIADDEAPQDVVAAMQAGAEGYLSNHFAPDLVLRALSFVLKGDTYVPRSAVAHLPFSLEARLKGDCEVPGGSVDDEGAGGSLPTFGNDTFAPSALQLDLSERQQAILEGLCRGEPNKAIGRALNLPESTVKVHVREIMRKLAVSNRTQVAVAVSRMGGKPLSSAGHLEDGFAAAIEQPGQNFLPPNPANHAEGRSFLPPDVTLVNGSSFRHSVSKIPKIR
jgi:DNA-binding NarL/FixJ family response regulator